MRPCHADSKVIASITFESRRTTKPRRVGRRHVRAAEEPQQVDEGECVLVVEQLVAVVTGDPIPQEGDGRSSVSWGWWP
jgi:hypothetical protein